MAGDRERFELAEETHRRLMSYPGVHTISLGPKQVGGRYTGTFSIQVLVAKKLPPHELRPDEMIPPEIQGVPTDVIEEEPARLLAGCRIDDDGKCRPLIGGTQVQALHGIDASGTGTLGCLARTKEPGNNLLVLLSNAHVIGDQDSDIGDKVGQPSMCSICSPCCSDPVGHVLRFKKTAHVDAAIATINDDVPHTARQIKEIGTVAGTRHLSQPEATSALVDVQKRGAASGKTLGTVVGWVPQQTIHTHTGSVYRTATDQLRISVRAPSACFAIPGDSGSVVLDTNRNVVALLHAAAGSTGDTGYATPIQFVEDELNIEILTATAEVQVDCSGGSSTPTLAEVAHPEAAGLLNSAAGQVASALFDRHLAEVRALVRNRLRVTAVWRRNGGPELVQLLAQSAQRPERPIPAEWNGQPLGDRIRRILDVLAQYGSAGLRADIERYGSFLASCGGLTLPQLARRLPEEM